MTDEPQTYDEAVERVHRAFCDPEHELVGPWDQEMAAALKRNGYAIVRAEPPDSGDGAALDNASEATRAFLRLYGLANADAEAEYESIYGESLADVAKRITKPEPRDAGIDADALAVAIRRTRTTSRLYRQDRLAAPLIAEYLAWRDPRNVLRSGSPAPEGGE